MVAFTKRPVESSAAREAADPITGQQLLASFVETGRQEPFEEIVRRYAGMVYNTCLRVTKSRADAEDASQAVFLTLALQVKKGTEIKALGPWLQQVAKRLSLDSHRGGKRRRSREQLHHNERTWRAACSQEEQLPPADLDDIKSVLHEELNKLPSKYRLPLVLHYFGGLSREQMAEELGCKPSTLGVRIFRARALLAERLSSRGVDFTPALLPALLHHMVRSTVSHVVIGTTSRAAAALTDAHQAAGLVSNRVIALTRRAAAAAVVGKLKVAAVALLVSTTLLLATARALCSVERVGLRDFLDRQVQSLVGPLLQPFSLPPLPIRLSQRPVDGFDPMLPHWTRLDLPHTALAAGWKFGPLVPWQTSSDPADLLSALDNPVAVSDVFATWGTNAEQPGTESLADAEEDLTTQLLDADASAGGGGAGGGEGEGSNAAQAADDAQAAAPGGGGGSDGGGVSFHLPRGPVGEAAGKDAVDGSVSGRVWGSAAGSHAQDAGRNPIGHSSDTGASRSPAASSEGASRPSHGGPPNGLAAQDRRHVLVSRHRVRPANAAGKVWNLGRSTRLPSCAVPLQHGEPSHASAGASFPSTSDFSPALSPAAAIDASANAGILPATGTASPMVIGEIAADVPPTTDGIEAETGQAFTGMDATPTAELVVDASPLALNLPASITPEPAALFLLSGVAGYLALRRSRRGTSPRNTNAF